MTINQGAFTDTYGRIVNHLNDADKRREGRLRRGFRKSMQMGVCFHCEAALICVSGAAYDVERCMTCRSTKVFVRADGPLVSMLQAHAELPAGKMCQAATHKDVSCPKCNNSSDSTGNYGPWAERK